MTSWLVIYLFTNEANKLLVFLCLQKRRSQSPRASRWPARSLAWRIPNSTSWEIIRSIASTGQGIRRDRFDQPCLASANEPAVSLDSTIAWLRPWIRGRELGCRCKRLEEQGMSRSSLFSKRVTASGPLGRLASRRATSLSARALAQRVIHGNLDDRCDLSPSPCRT